MMRFGLTTDFRNLLGAGKSSSTVYAERASRVRGGSRYRPKLRIPASEYSFEIAIEHFGARL
jgi:hypothetical protein